MLKTAVIGANGFLGKRLVQAFIEKGHQVTAVYNRNYSNIPQGCALVSFAEFMEKELQFDHLVFAAGSFSNTHQQLISINCKLLMRLSQKYAEARLVYISSTNVYGTHKGPVSEDSSFNNPSLYGRAKLAGEFVVSASKSYALLRLAYLYGPGLENKSFIPTIMHHARHHNRITLMGKGEREQDYLYVDDAAALCVKVAEHQDNGVFLGASGHSVSNLEVARHICAHVQPCEIEFSGEEKADSFYFDPSQTFQRLDWRPKVSFAEGIKRCLA